MTDVVDAILRDQGAHGVRGDAPQAARAPLDARELALALGAPQPTDQQVRVIEAPLAPALVVAGAGSGKTETMASRVLWLLANGHVRAENILGLTFTRKAAGELGHRLRRRIEQLRASGVAEIEYDPFDPPVVATYNSFANTLYRENAPLLGREPDAIVLGEASAWQLARSIAVASDDSRLPRLDKSLDAVTAAVLSLSRAVNENVADVNDIRRMAERFAALSELPPGGRGAYNDVTKMVQCVDALPVLLGLAERYEQLKRERGFIEFSDQVALALAALRRNPSIGDELRSRYSVVLLDEYQDTSVVQSMLLAELFAHHPVMAVGDPNQSIYGWRGASAANLGQFAHQFGGGTAARYSLSTSWRNGRAILAAANEIASPLALIAEASNVAVDRLEPSPHASEHAVDVAVTETLRDEAERVAEWLADALEVPGGETEPPSAALLLRTRAHQDVFLSALRRRGVPYHVLGVGGLLAEPEIADLVSALTVLDDPQAGSELVRLLAGARWRIGPRDLRMLRVIAQRLRDRDYAFRPLDESVKAALRASIADDEDASIVDALDFVAHVSAEHSVLTDVSVEGRRRLREAGQFFARLRREAHGEVTELVTRVYEALHLDIESLANESRPADGAAIEAFRDALADYLAVSRDANLSGFLAWLRQAQRRDNLAPRPEDPEPGTVQVLTIHGSKGLEWDYVVVPRLVDDELPGSPLEGYTGWLRFGELPYEFRGDSAQLPVFAWQGAATRKELCDEKKRFADALKVRHEHEERRLLYVAVTRARNRLLLTSSFWAGHASARRPSRFITPLPDAGVLPDFALESEHETDPSDDRGETIVWPLDPLGGRRDRVESAAREVLDALDGNECDTSAGRWQRDIDALLEERRVRIAGDERVPLPSRVPASRFNEFVSNPEAVAAGLRRPLPRRPHREARLGTVFHTWVENRSRAVSNAPALDDIDVTLDPVGSDNDRARLAALVDNFERSPWAARVPVDVEREIHVPLAGTTVVCKIDAVYAEGDRFQVVDWKTGRAPRDDAELERRQLQLALYRIAYARWAGVSPERVDAVFYFVADDEIVTPTRLLDDGELAELWRGILTDAP